MKEDEDEQKPDDPELPPVDMAVAMEAARELSPELLNRSAEVLGGSLTGAQEEEAIEALLNEFNRRLNEDYRRRLNKKAEGSDRQDDA